MRPGKTSRHVVGLQPKLLVINYVTHFLLVQIILESMFSSLQQLLHKLCGFGIDIQLTYLFVKILETEYLHSKYTHNISMLSPAYAFSSFCAAVDLDINHASTQVCKKKKIYH